MFIESCENIFLNYSVVSDFIDYKNKTIKGQITFKNGEPISNSLVCLMKVSNHVIYEILSTYSDNNGFFYFKIWCLKDYSSYKINVKTKSSSIHEENNLLKLCHSCEKFDAINTACLAFNNLPNI